MSSRARKIADLLDSSGDVKVTHLDNVPANLTSATTVPSSPTAGDQWFDTANGILYTYMTDGTQAQWLDISSANGQAAAAAGGGGAMELIATSGNISGVEDIIFTNIPSTYAHYVVKVNLATPGSSDVYLRAYPSMDNGATYPSTIVHGQHQTQFGAVQGGSGGQISLIAVGLEYLQSTINISSMTQFAYTAISGGRKQSNANVYSYAAGGLTTGTTGTINAIKFNTINNISSGTIEIYGIKDS